MLRRDVVVQTEADVASGAAVRCVEAEPGSVASVAELSVIRGRSQVNQLLDARIDRTVRQR